MKTLLKLVMIAALGAALGALVFALVPFHAPLRPQEQSSPAQSFTNSSPLRAVAALALGG